MAGDWTANSGYRIGLKLAEDKEMTAVYAANDQMAMGVIAALRSRGRRVPQDVSVVGIDDSMDAMVPNIELTTVRFDLRKRGRLVYEHAIADTPATPVALRIPGTLVERSTVAAAVR